MIVTGYQLISDMIICHKACHKESHINLQLSLAHTLLTLSSQIPDQKDRNGHPLIFKAVLRWPWQCTSET